MAAVIPAWNSETHLRRCLDALVPQLAAPSDVLVVDNGSADGTQELLREMGVRSLLLERNIGFAPAVNLGVSRTASEFVLVLNADATPLPGCLDALEDALDRDPTLGGVQPCILQEGGAPTIYSAGQQLRRDGRAFERGAGQPDGPAFRAPAEIFGVCGAACLLRRTLLDELGGYDEHYFAFHEDVDLNARARMLGWRFGYVPKATVLHVGNASWLASAPRPTRFNTRLVARNRLATDLKVMDLRYAPLVMVAEAGAVVRSVRRRTLLAAVGGRLGALRWLPRLFRERRRLRARGHPELLRAWLS